MSAGTMQAELSYRELSQLKWLLGSLLALISLWTVFDLDNNGGLLLYVATVALLAAMVRPSWPSIFKESFWKMATPAIILWVAGDFLINQPDFMGPLIRMVLLLLLVRAIQYRRKREDLQLLILCLFTVVISGVLTLSLTFGLQMLVFAPVSMLLLLVINLAESHRERCPMPEGTFEDFNHYKLFKRLREVVDARFLAVSSALFIAVGVVAAVIFTLMPRVSLDQALPFLSLSSQQRSGFSGEINYDTIADIQEDNSIAFRVDFSESVEPPATPYWRMVVLDEYFVNDRGRDGFRTSQSAKSKYLVADNRIRESWPWPREGGQRGDWTFYLEGGITDYIPTLGYAKEIRFQGRQSLFVNNKLRQWRTKEVSTRTLFFQWHDVIPLDYVPGTNEDFNRGIKLETFSAEIAGRYRHPALQYPKTTLVYPSGPANGDQLEAIVAELTQGEDLDPSEFSARAIEYLTSRHEYSMQMRIPGGDGLPLIRWLVSEEPGYCELFAGAFTLMARAAGYPARVIGGYKGGTLNGFENYYSVRNREAHAWAEIYDFDRRIWLRIDPTPGSSQPIGGSEEQQENTFARSFIDNTFQAYLDSLRVVWYRRIVNFDQQSQENLASNLKEISESFGVAFKEELRALSNNVRNWFFKPWTQAKVFEIVQWITILGVGSILGLSAVKWLRNRGGKRTDPTRARAGKLIARFREQEPDFTNERAQFTQEDWRSTYGALQALRYGPDSGRPAPTPVFHKAKELLRLRSRI